MMARYVGGGAWLHGIPARDLTAEEWEALSQEQRDAATARGLYVVEETAEPEATADEPADNG